MGDALCRLGGQHVAEWSVESFSFPCYSAFIRFINITLVADGRPFKPWEAKCLWKDGRSWVW